MKSKNILAKNIAFGLMLGIFLGLYAGNIALWIGMGTLAGVARTNYLTRDSREDKKET